MNSGPLILITGGTGFIGNHTVAQFLSNGYRVRATARNQSSCNRLADIHKNHKDSLETQIVPDITVPGAFDEAVKGVDGVIHMASPFTYKITDNETDLIIPAIRGTQGILKSTATFAPQVKRVVLTSSFAAVADFAKGPRPGHVYDESQWNPMSYQDAKDDKRGLAYAGSKKLAEEAAWDFIKSTPVNFSLSTINPTMVYGPPLAGSSDLKHLGQSPSEIYALMNGPLTEVPTTPLPAYVDVRDVAKAHRLAFETEQPGRFLMSGGSFSKQQVCDLLREKLPDIKDKVPVGAPGAAAGDHYTVDTTRAKTVLGLEFLPFASTFLDMAKFFLDLENAENQSKV